MPKRPAEEQMHAAVAAGSPPESASFTTDKRWHAAQDRWVAAWSSKTLPESAKRREAWKARKKEHARLMVAAAKHMANLEQAVAGLCVGKRKNRDAPSVAQPDQLLSNQPPSITPASSRAELLRQERERSQRRRDQQRAAAEVEREHDATRARRDEQAALLAAIDAALARSDQLRKEWDSAGFWDEPLCLAIRAWAVSHAAPDGSQAWEDALVAIAVPAASLRLDTGVAPAHAYRRPGALHTLRWLLRGLSFKPTPGAFSPDPIMSVEARAERGYCVCGCRLPPCHKLSTEDLALGGQPSEEERDRGNGAVPFCRVHQRRCAPRRLAPQPYVACTSVPPVFSDGRA